MLTKAIIYNRKHHGVSQTKRIQVTVGATPDGLWGPRTVASVVAWQADHHLSADGMVGPETLTAMKAGASNQDRIDSLRWDTSENIQRLHRTGTRELVDVTELVIHESVTTSWLSTQRVLANRDLGVHLMIHEDGMVSQHGELTDIMSHCPKHNANSVGIEVVNPYEPRFMGEDCPWVEYINAPWAHRGSYVLATQAQCEALADVIADLIKRLDIEPIWHGLKIGDGEPHHWALTDVEPKAGETNKGIWAHQQIGGHADGSWPLMVAALILQGQDPQKSYGAAARAATGVRQWAIMPGGV